MKVFKVTKKHWTELRSGETIISSWYRYYHWVHHKYYPINLHNSITSESKIHDGSSRWQVRDCLMYYWFAFGDLYHSPPVHVSHKGLGMFGRFAFQGFILPVPVALPAPFALSLFLFFPPDPWIFLFPPPRPPPREDIAALRATFANLITHKTDFRCSKTRFRSQNVWSARTRLRLRILIFRSEAPKSILLQPGVESIPKALFFRVRVVW